MAGWSGFTDEELSRLKYAQTNEEIRVPRKVNLNPNQREAKLKQKVNKKRPQNGMTTQQQSIPEIDKQSGLQKDGKNVNENGTQSIEAIGTTNDKLQPMNNDVKFESENPEAKNCKSNSGSTTVTKPQTLKQNTNEGGNNKSSDSIMEKRDAADIKLLSEHDAVELQMTKLERLQKIQKEIEEENKLKQKIIKDAITERYRKAQVEASTLQNIQKELAALDNLLACDVEILRKRIEDASFAFSHAQKRYEKAEKEFVDAKLDLQLKSDKKEQLTQHLYTIIQENELRKGKKLKELMSKLNMHEDSRTKKDIALASKHNVTEEKTIVDDKKTESQEKTNGTINEIEVKTDP